MQRDGGATQAATVAENSAAGDVVARAMALRSVFGITRIANLTGLDRTGVPVVMVCRPNARSSAVFNGKGLDVAAAKASGVMEAVETWHAENVALPLRFASAADLENRLELVDLDGLARIPGARLDRRAPMLWVKGRNLMDGRRIWLPFEIVHADWRASGPPASNCFAMSTNGLSSGDSFFGAVRHALCEIIERDATSLWHQLSAAEQEAARVDLATVDDANSLALLDLLAKAGLDVGVWDITTDVGVSVYQCVLRDCGGHIAHIGVGAACHPRREVAFLRAVLEAAQVRTTYVIGSREDIDEADYAEATLARRDAEARALLRPTGRMRSFASAPNAGFESSQQEVGWILNRLRSIGLTQAIVVDLTKPEYAIPVVRVVVPGLEGSDHHAAQYLPGPRARTARESRP